MYGGGDVKKPVARTDQEEDSWNEIVMHNKRQFEQEQIQIKEKEQKNKQVMKDELAQ